MKTGAGGSGLGGWKERNKMQGWLRQEVRLAGARK
ncbi:hypothetical protein M388_02030 [Mesotoga sp. Brook.08.YT.4.2.5.4.]|nr:hypothetical protein M388_02030 [Mesotoga sp. Brook.08.YT.4.2.5.4.]